MEKLILVPVQPLAAIVIMVAIEIVGLVQFLKNYIKPKYKRTYASVTFFVAAGCSYLNSGLVPATIIVPVNIFLLSLAVTQLAWDVIKDGLPKLVGKAMKLDDANKAGA